MSIRTARKKSFFPMDLRVPERYRFYPTTGMRYYEIDDEKDVAELPVTVGLGSRARIKDSVPRVLFILTENGWEELDRPGARSGDFGGIKASLDD